METPPPPPEPPPDSVGNGVSSDFVVVLIGLLVVVVLILCLVYWGRPGPSDGGGSGGPNKTFWPWRYAYDKAAAAVPSAPSDTPLPQFDPNLSRGYPYSWSFDGKDPADSLMTTQEVDPIVTGQLYARTRTGGYGRRPVYGARTSHANSWGMSEYSESRQPGVGSTIGPVGVPPGYMAAKYDVFDDGIPSNWHLPSTPTRWYVPASGSDYYDVVEMTVRPGAVGQPLREPDHEPLVN